MKVVTKFRKRGANHTEVCDNVSVGIEWRPGNLSTKTIGLFFQVYNSNDELEPAAKIEMSDGEARSLAKRLLDAAERQEP